MGWRLFEYGLSLVKEAKRYFGGWLGGFEWAVLVGVDAFAYGKTGS